MNVAKLIKKLEEFPRDAEVRIFDWRKNLNEESGDGSGNSAGVYQFEVSMEILSDDEKEYYKEMHDQDYKSWVQLSFESDDYNDDGGKIE